MVLIRRFLKVMVFFLFFFLTNFGIADSADLKKNSLKISLSYRSKIHGNFNVKKFKLNHPIKISNREIISHLVSIRYKGKFLTYKDYSWVHSLHDEKKWKDNPDLTWGKWMKPVWPSNRSLQGSIPTPYIFDDRPSFEDFADVLKEWYDMGPEKRRERGLLGHKFAMSDEAMMSASAMCQNFIDHMDTAFEKWTPRKRYTIFEV